MSEIRKRAAEFAARWAHETYEKGESQSFWTEFLTIFGIDRKRVASFEARARRLSTGNHGFVDMLWRGMLLVEQKSAGKDLSAATNQAFDYLDDLTDAEFPRAVVVSDFAHIQLTMFEGKDAGVTQVLRTADLAKEIDRFAFLAGYTKRDYSKVKEQEVNAQAVKLIGDLYKEIVNDAHNSHESAIFVTRLLFLLFGDDTGLWQRGLFTDLVDGSPEDGEALTGLLAQLFSALNKEQRSSKTNELVAKFPHVNGHLFHERIEIPTFDSTMRAKLIACCNFDWGSISPAIFGSMFQIIKSRIDRHEHGEHYTSEERILATIRPLFLDDLRVQLDKAGHDVAKLQRLQKSLTTYRFADFASGCGNFLVVAYREMRQFELEILIRLRDAQGGQTYLSDFEVADTLAVSPTQFLGVEIEEWPARLSEVAFFLVDHQSNMRLSQEFGRAPERLPITVAARFLVGNALDLDWSALLPDPDANTIIMGNPPFVAMYKMTAEQQADRARAFALLPESKGHRTGRLDYVASWFAKAIDYARGTAARIALVSTNSITQGDSARALDPILRDAGFKIFFAHDTFKWDNEAAGKAAVYCVIIGITGGPVKGARLFDYEDVKGPPQERAAKQLNFYLLDTELPGPVKRSKPFIPGLPKMEKGSQPTDGRGNLLISPEQYADVASDPIAAKFIQPFAQSGAVLDDEQRWCLWLVDSTPSDRAGSPALRSRLNAVRDERLKSPTLSVQQAADTPWLFTQRRQPTTTWLGVPRHSSENRICVPMRDFPPTTIAGDALSYLEDCPDWVFVYLQSSAFTSWVRTFSGALESRFRISPDMTYNVFPFVEPAGTKVKAFAEIARQLRETRSMFPNESLSTLYDSLGMPAELRDVHRRLDALVDGMFGLKKPTDNERALALLRKHHELVDRELLVTTKPVPSRRRRSAVTTT